SGNKNVYQYQGVFGAIPGASLGTLSSASNLTGANGLAVTSNSAYMFVVSTTNDQVLQFFGTEAAPTTGKSTGSVVVPANDPNGATSSIVFPVDNNTFPIAHLSVNVNISATADANLTGFLIAPDGTQITLFQGLTGQNLTNTTFDDLSNTPITAGTAPYD